MADEKPESEGLVSPTDDPERFMAQMRERVTAEEEPEEQPGEGEAPPAPTAEASTPAPPAEGAEESASASPQPAPTSWRDIPIPEDVAGQYRFFQGKKTGDFFDSYRALEHELQERGRKQRELETKVIALETWKDMTRPSVEPPKLPDPFAGLDPDVDPIANPGKWQAAQQEQHRRDLEAAAEKAKREALEEFERRQAETAFKQHEAAVINALTIVQNKLELDDERFADLAPALLQGVTRRGGVPQQSNPNAYLEVARGLGFQPKPAVTAASLPPPTPAATPANPPGAKAGGKAAPADAARSTTPTLSYERRMQLKGLRENFAAQHGEEAADEFYRTVAAKFAQERG